MPIRRFLHDFSDQKFEDRRMRDSTFELAVSRRPGMHQLIEDPDELALTGEDEDFLRGMGICTRLAPARKVSESAVAAEERRLSCVRA